jgi:hypothetical protein
MREQLELEEIRKNIKFMISNRVYRAKEIELIGKNGD